MTRGTIEKQYTVVLDTGMHTRPATTLVETANKYLADIQIEYEGKSANLKSILGVICLGIPKDATFKIMAEGQNAADAIVELEEAMKKDGLIAS